MPTKHDYLIWDETKNVYWTVEEVEEMLEKYLQWCQEHQGIPFQPKVKKFSEVTEETIFELTSYREYVQE